MRCPDCNKFVPFDEGNVDEVEFELDETTGTVTVSGRIVLPCAECGTELKECNVDDTVDVPDGFTELADDDGAVYDWETDPEATFAERTQTTDRHGKPIKNSRYMKVFKGFNASGVLRRVATIDGVSKTETVDWSYDFEEQASSFEECC